MAEARGEESKICSEVGRRIQELRSTHECQSMSVCVAGITPLVINA